MLVKYDSKGILRYARLLIYLCIRVCQGSSLEKGRNQEIGIHVEINGTGKTNNTT